MTPGERIKVLRKELKLTQEDIGNALGIQKAAVQKYEKGTVKNIKRENLIKLAKLLNTTPEYILGWEELPDNLVKNMTMVSPDEFVTIPILAKV